MLNRDFLICSPFSPAGVPIAKSSPDSKRKAQTEKSRALACQAAKVLDEYKGQDIKILDLTTVTPIADFFVVATGSSTRQMKAAAEEVHRLMKANGSKRLGFEGEGANTWILQDYGDIVIHLFTPESRELYDLDHLWGDAVTVDWGAATTPAKKKPAPKLAATDEEEKPAPAKKAPRKKSITPRKKKPKTNEE